VSHGLEPRVRICLVVDLSKGVGNGGIRSKVCPSHAKSFRTSESLAVEQSEHSSEAVTANEKFLA
jgi:hypothetical protein